MSDKEKISWKNVIMNGGFKLPDMYSHHVTKFADVNFINDVIYHNNIDMVGA